MSPKIDVNFFKPFIDGTRTTFKIQCGVEITHGKPFFKGTQKQPSFEIAGIIGITSAGFNGSIAICFPEQVYLKIMSNMLGENYTQISDDLKDGAAELLNIIYGSAKVVLNQQGHSILKAIPTVISGSNLNTSHFAKSKVMVLPFRIEEGEFDIEIAVDDLNAA